MPGREVKFLNDWSGGLNSNSDPKDLDDSQQHLSHNIDYRVGGQIRPLGNPTYDTKYDTIEAVLMEGKGLFSYNSPYSVVSVAANGSAGISLTNTQTQSAFEGEYATVNISPGAFTFNFNQLTSPIALSGFMWKSGTYEQSVTGCSWTGASTGVLVKNETSYYTPNLETNKIYQEDRMDKSVAIEVDGVDATTKFEVGDEIFKWVAADVNAFAKVGVATKVDTNLIEINGAPQKMAYPLGQHGNRRGINESLLNNDVLYAPTVVSCTADMSGNTLLVPGAPIDIADEHTDIPPTTTQLAAESDWVGSIPQTKIAKVRHKELVVNGDFASTPAKGTSNAQWTDSTIDANYKLTIAHDTNGLGYRADATLHNISDTIATTSKAVGSVTFSGTGLPDAHAITLIDSNGISKTYESDDSGGIANGDMVGSNVGFICNSDPEIMANNFAAAVNSANGHNVAITTWAHPDVGKITLTQNNPGATGDTTISGTSHANVTFENFTGGASSDKVTVPDTTKIDVNDLLILKQGSAGKFNQSQEYNRVASIVDATNIRLVGAHNTAGAVNFHIIPGNNKAVTGKTKSMKLTLASGTKGVVWYKMTDCVVGKEYTAEVMTHSIGMSAGDITKVRLVAHSALVFGANAGNLANISYQGQDCTTFDKIKLNRLTFTPSATTYYVGIYVEGTDAKSLYCDNFSIQSRWFVDRFTTNLPLSGTHSGQTIKVAKVLFHDLHLHKPSGGFSSHYRNWLGFPLLLDTDPSGGSNLEWVSQEADYQTMFNEMVDLINGTNEQENTLGAIGDAYENSSLDYGNYKDDWKRAFAGNCSAQILATNPGTDAGDNYLNLKAKTIGVVPNDTQIHFTSFINPIRYDCRGINYKYNPVSYPVTMPHYTWDFTVAVGDYSESADGINIFDYVQYGRGLQTLTWYDSESNADGYKKYSRTQKATLTSHNGYPPSSGLEFSSNNLNRFSEHAQEFITRLENGIDPRVQINKLELGGTIDAGDMLKVIVDGDQAAKMVTVTADGTPTLAEMMDASTGITKKMNDDAQIAAIYTSSYTGESNGKYGITCTGVSNAVSFSISHETYASSTEYVDDKHIAHLGSNAVFTFNSSRADNQWVSFASASAIWANVVNPIDPVFYSDGGKLRICDGNFTNDNPVKGFRYIYNTGLFSNSGGTANGLDITQWDLSDSEVAWNKLTTHNVNVIRGNMYDAPAPSAKQCHLQFEIDRFDINGAPSYAAGGMVTFTTNVAHGLAIGDDIDIVGTASYDGRYEILEVPSTTTLKIDSGLDSDPGDGSVGSDYIYPVGYWEETYQFYASAYDIDGNETLPEHNFYVESGVRELALAGRKLKFAIEVDPGDAPTIANGLDSSSWITPWQYAGFRIYYSKSEDGFGEKWHLGDIDFKKGFIRTDNGDVYSWKQQDGDSVQPNSTASITGNNIDFINFTAPVDVETYESLNGYSSKNDLLSARYKNVAIIGRRAYIGNVFYGATHYNDRMIVSPYNMLDVFPTPYNVIEVTNNDGQAITALMGYGDRLLQFKNQYLYIINVASGEPSTFHLEASHRFFGCKSPNHLVETEKGIIWANSLGVYMYDGQPDNIIDLHAYKSEEDIKGSTGVGEDDRNVKRIKSDDWSNFYNEDLIVGYNPVEKIVIFKRSCKATDGSGDCYIYDLQGDMWTFAAAKWSDGIKVTNFVTDLDENLINMAEGSLALSSFNGGEIKNKKHMDGTS